MMGMIVGSPASCARMLHEVAAMPSVKGIMLCFDDFIKGMDDFGQKIQPLMKCRQDKVAGRGLKRIRYGWLKREVIPLHALRALVSVMAI
jgi:hypothetical protein